MISRLIGLALLEAQLDYPTIVVPCVINCEIYTTGLALVEHRRVLPYVMSTKGERPLLKTKVLRTAPKPDGNSFKYDDEIRFEIEPVDQRGGHRGRRQRRPLHDSCCYVLTFQQ